MNTIFCRAILALLLAIPVISTVHAQVWPARPIKLIVPFGPGSATDTLARTISGPLSTALGQPVVIDNRPGANSTLGTSIVAKAEPDGYTLALATNAGIAASPAGLTENTPYDPVKDLRYVSLVGSISYVWLANISMPVNNAKEMIDYIKANPGALNYASGNTGGISYGGLIKNNHGLDITHVPYKSTPPALIDLIGGRVQVMMADVASATPMVNAGQVKALGVPVKARNPLLPEVSTFEEQGLPSLPDISGWWVVAAPAGTPDAIVDKLNAELVKVLGMEDIRVSLLKNGIVATPTTREVATKYQQEQLDVWRRLVKELDLSVN